MFVILIRMNHINFSKEWITKLGKKQVAANNILRLWCKQQIKENGMINYFFLNRTKLYLNCKKKLYFVDFLFLSRRMAI